MGAILSVSDKSGLVGLAKGLNELGVSLFSDGVELAAKGGVRAIIQPGGSLRDEETIEVANKYDIAMVFTGQRHFKH